MVWHCDPVLIFGLVSMVPFSPLAFNLDSGSVSQVSQVINC